MTTDDGSATTPLESEKDIAVRIGQSYSGPARVVFVVNSDWWFLSHRATWGSALQASGSEVVVIAEDTGKAAVIEALGFRFIPVAVGRESSGIITMLRSAVQIFTTLIRLRPQVIFLTAQAAYTLGWPAAVLLRNTNFIRVVSGAGRALAPQALSTRASKVVRLAGRVASRLPNIYTLFQLEHDRQTFQYYDMLPDVRRSLVVPGTGIDPKKWQREWSRDFEHPIILFAARLFREKGIYEFVAAAEALQDRGWRFQVAGDPDDGVATAVPSADIDRWRREGAIELLGHCDDMVSVLGSATVFVLPTRHPEGTPKVLIEAGAAGVPAIVSGQPGCKAVVEDGVTGVVLDPEPSAADIAAAIEALASNPVRAHQMGAAAMSHISGQFSLEAVLSKLLDWEALRAVRV